MMLLSRVMRPRIVFGFSMPARLADMMLTRATSIAPIGKSPNWVISRLLTRLLYALRTEGFRLVRPSSHFGRVRQLRPVEPRHLHAFQRRPPAHHSLPVGAGPRTLHEPLHVGGGSREGEQLPALQRAAVAKPRVRRSLFRRKNRDRSGEADGAVHPDERGARAGRRGAAHRPSRDHERARDHDQGRRPYCMGSRLLAPRVLVSRGVAGAPTPGTSQRWNAPAGAAPLGAGHSREPTAHGPL